MNVLSANDEQNIHTFEYFQQLRVGFCRVEAKILILIKVYNGSGSTQTEVQIA